MENEKRLIDANAFWNRLNNTVYDLFDPESDFGYSPGIIKIVLDQTKTVDAVEVVRCKDCYNCTKSKWCNLLMMNVKDEWFCSHGKRKDNG